MDLDHSQFSEREKEVVALLLQGKSNKQIALELHIAQSTVEYHLKNIYQKLEVSSRTEAVLRLGASIRQDPPSEEVKTTGATESKDTTKHLSVPKVTVHRRHRGIGVLVATSAIVLLSCLYLSAQKPCGPQDLARFPLPTLPPQPINPQRTDMVWLDQIVYVLDPLNSEQTLADIRRQVPDLKDLGITSVLLGPVFSEQNFREVHPSLGTDDELRQLIADFHSTTNGPRINVLLNLHMSTVGDQHPWRLQPTVYLRLWDEQNLGDNSGCNLEKGNCQPVIMLDNNNTKVDHGFGDFRWPLLNHTLGMYTNTGVYREVKDTIFRLVDDFAFDGIRYATAHYYCAAFWPKFMRDFHKRYDRTKPDFWHVGEVFILPPDQKTWQIPAHEFVNGTSSIGPIQMDGVDDFQLQQLIQEVAAKGTCLPDSCMLFLAHLKNPGNIREPERLTASINNALTVPFVQAVQAAGEEENFIERFRLASVLLMTVNRVPLIQSGNEYSVDYTHPRVPADEPDETFRQYFKKLIQIRRNHAAFRRGSFTPLVATDSVMSYARQLEGKTFLVVLNLDARPKQDFEIDLRELGEACSSPTNLLVEDDQNIQSADTSLFVSLKPWEPKIVQCE